MEDSCVSDAIFTLVDNNGEIAETGLYTSHHLLR